MQFYNSSFSGKNTVHPQFEQRGNHVFATRYNKDFAGKTTLPLYEVRGNQMHTTMYNPLGHHVNAMFEIKGNDVHTTIHNPEHTHMPVFHIK